MVIYDNLCSFGEVYVWQNTNCQIHNVTSNDPLWIEHVSARSQSMGNALRYSIMFYHDLYNFLVLQWLCIIVCTAVLIIVIVIVIIIVLGCFLTPSSCVTLAVPEIVICTVLSV